MKSIRQTIFKLCKGLRYKHHIIVLYSVRQCWSTKTDSVIKVRSLDLYYPPTGSKVNLYRGTKEVLGFLSATFRGEVKDQFGLDPALSDRIKAAEDMAKHHKLLTDSLEVKADSSFADALSKARRRAAKGERDAP